MLFRSKRVTASATDRTVPEAAELLARLPAQARAARARAGASERAGAGASEPDGTRVSEPDGTSAEHPTPAGGQSS